MTVKRMDNGGIVGEDIDAANEFFTELGLELDAGEIFVWPAPRPGLRWVLAWHQSLQRRRLTHRYPLTTAGY